MAEETLGTQNYFDPFASAPAGHSLTEDNTKWPWGKPSQYVDPEEALDASIKSLMNEENKQEMFKLLMVGISVEVLVEGMIFVGFQEGKYTPDVGLMMKNPLALVIADMAEEEGIPYRFFENDNELDKGKMDDATFIRMMRENNPRAFEYLRESLNETIRAGQRPMEETFISMKKPETGDEE